MPDGLEERLRAFVDERNWLVHRSVHQNSDDILVQSKRRELIERVRRIYESAGTLKKELEKVVFAWGSARGLDEAEAERIAIEKMNGLLEVQQ